MKPKRITVPADVYDTLEMSSMMHGGIGCGSFISPFARPVCLIGHAVWSGILPDIHSDRSKYGNLFRIDDNDFVVRIHSVWTGSVRMSWKLYCEARNIVRGK